jgi:hypothetical protein
VMAAASAALARAWAPNGLGRAAAGDNQARCSVPQ